MPIYEYFCQDCRKRVSVFFPSMATARDEDARCPHCGGAHLRRLVSRVFTLRSEESRLESLADSSLMAGLENEDPRALAHFMRQMSDEMGEPLDPEMTEVIDRLEAGESPEAIEESLGEAGMGDDFGGGFGGDLGGEPVGGLGGEDLGASSGDGAE